MIMEIYNKPDRENNEQISCSMYNEHPDKSGKPNMLRVYDSLSDLVSDVETNIHNNTWTNKVFRSGGTRQSWVFGTDMPDLTTTTNAVKSGMVNNNMLSKVDQFKIDILKQYPELLSLERSAYQSKRKRRFSEVGDELDIDRYMCGDPAQWSERPMMQVKNSLKICFQLGQNAGNDADTVQRNMVAFAAMSDILQAAGISTEIHICFAIRRAGDVYEETMTTVKIKSANDVLDISNMLASGLSGVFRHFIFYERANLTPSIDSSLGCTQTEKSDFVQRCIDKLDIDIYAGGDSIESKMHVIIDGLKTFIKQD